MKQPTQNDADEWLEHMKEMMRDDPTMSEDEKGKALLTHVAAGLYIHLSAMVSLCGTLRDIANAQSKDSFRDGVRRAVDMGLPHRDGMDSF